MIKTNWINTNDIYRQILAAPDARTRQDLYLHKIMQPWKPMMDMMAQQFMGNSTDPLAGARTFGWLLPDQTEEIRSLLAQIEAAHAWEDGEAAFQLAASRFEPFTERIPFASIEGWLLLADPARSNPMEGGYTGATDWLEPRFVCQFWELKPRYLERIGSLVAHEMHHLIRMRVFPFNPMTTTVADYIVIEGTAEAFAASLFGEEKIGTFITDFDSSQLEIACTLIGSNLDANGFNVIRGYIFGDELASKYGFQPAGGMPTYGGYTVGYQVVRTFLQRTGMSIEEATFLPAKEIVEGSGYFQ
ncbi:MAG: hypothetical protein CVU39_08175 [Chloroflexi bacterium HGW-Chloroflexi-10]|nr:MAG: hypothetical protein CVU39_08175 [Chloroflexi bacterium HGW-Chloroflexi-10]